MCIVCTTNFSHGLQIPGYRLCLSPFAVRILSRGVDWSQGIECDAFVSEERVMLLILVPHGRLVDDRSMLSRDCYPRLTRARDSVVRGLRIGVGPERQ